MEKGARALAILILLALLLGLVIIAVNPDYRQAAICQWNGKPDQSPIWVSNAEFYPDVTLKPGAPRPTPTVPDDADSPPVAPQPAPASTDISQQPGQVEP